MNGPSPIPDLSAGGRRWKKLACYVPLMAIGFEVIWIVSLVMGILFMVGDEPYINTDAKEHFFQIIAALPVTAGLLFGLVATVCRWPGRMLEWIGLILGILGCGAIVFGFATGFLR
ncbi:MAG TPA: hypothetical protein VL981_09205 [Candidatus Methylacidiphilales bacterium]|nr:hypothetical protein [Candidatus Methylacidiphilales bacterium]